jgi:hypothetical protein
MQELMDGIMFSLFDIIVEKGEIQCVTAEEFVYASGASRAEIRYALKKLIKDKALVKIIIDGQEMYSVPPEQHARVLALLIGERVD